MGVFYLFGAGASIKNSFNSSIPMPLAHNFHEVINRLKESNSYNRLISGSNHKSIDSDINEFLNFIVKYNSIDEAMRKLYINGDKPKFLKYKKFIQLIFYFIESPENYRDSRYTQFLLTLVDDNLKLPNEIKILSWNYDSQLELAAKDIDLYFNDNTLDETNFFKLNCLHASPFILKNDPELEDAARLSIVSEIIDKEETIKFAWEKQDNSLHRFRSERRSDFLNSIDELAFNSIVSIGYSFPFVNHTVDRELIFKINPKIIYIQNPDDYIAESIKERFSLPNVKIVPIKNCDRFHIPNELYV